MEYFKIYWPMSDQRARVVIDTGVIVSAILKAQSVPAEAVSIAMRTAAILISDDTIAELYDVLSRPGLSRYIDAQQTRSIVLSFIATAEHIAVISPIQACRDPKDDKFLALAISGGAQIIVTGDADLLALDPFQEIAIRTPRQYLNEWTGLVAQEQSE